MEYLRGCILRIREHNKEVKVWLMLVLLVPYLIICFLHDGGYWLWRKTGLAIDWLNAIIKRKT